MVSRRNLVGLMALGPIRAITVPRALAGTGNGGQRTGAPDADFAIQGEYSGDLVLDGERTQGAGLQVVALGGGAFHLSLYMGPLPGADHLTPVCEEADGRWVKGGEVLFKNDEGDARIRNGEAVITAGGKRLGVVRKVERKSPTLGQRPPKAAVVLFDSKSSDAWLPAAAGRSVDQGGLLNPGVISKRKFRDMLLHVEFQTPYLPMARGQARGNGGVLLQGCYEVQILDSFGSPRHKDEAASIYGLRPPLGNMSFPPLSWQTYDIEFQAAQWSGGRKARNATITLKHNGVIVHDHVEILGPTKSAPLAESPEPQPLHLEDGGSLVRYRNVWAIQKTNT